MLLYCTVCHTQWTEDCWNAYDKCPFLNCGGRLSTTPPQPKPARVPKPKPTMPLFEKSR